MEKFCTAGQGTKNNMAHAYCMLDNYGCKNILGICFIYFFALKQWLQEDVSSLRFTKKISISLSISQKFLACSEM
jgi:hypothetical protein